MKPSIKGIFKFDDLSLVLLVLLAFVSFFLPLGNAPLFDLDEGAFSEATREMLLSGDYITTYLNGELRFDKPILIYWFQALSVSVFGLNEIALRLPSALASSVWLVAIYFFVSKHINKTTALYSAILFVSTLQITIIAKAAIADALLNLFIALTMFAIYNYYKTQSNKYIYLSFVFMSLGFLTKGPVAIMVPSVVSIIFFVVRGKFSLWLKCVLNPIGIALFVIIAAPWYILEYMAQGQNFIDGFFLKHNVSRFNDSMEGHNGNYFYYILVLLFGLMPHTGLLLKSFTKVKEFFKDDLKLYLLIWFIFVLLFFTFSNTKLPHYIIYGYTPLFIFMATVLVDIKIENRQTYVVLFAPSIILFMLLLLIPYILQIAPIGDKFVSSIKGEIIGVFDLKFQTVIIGYFFFLSLLLKYSKFSLQNKFAINIFMFLLLINFLIVPLIAKVQQAPIRTIGLIAKDNNMDVVMYRLNTPSFNVYAQKIVRKNNPLEGDFVMTKKIYLEDFKEYEILYEDKGIVLIKLIKK